MYANMASRMQPDRRAADPEPAEGRRQPQHAQGAHPGRPGLAAAGARPLSGEPAALREGRRACSEGQEPIEAEHGRATTTSCGRSCSWCRPGAAGGDRGRAQGGRSAARPLQELRRGLAAARALRDVAVRDQVIRSSGDLHARAAQDARRRAGRPVDGAGSHPARRRDVRDLRQAGIQGRYARARSRPARPAYAERFEQQSKQYLQRLRREAMIEHK